MATCLSEQMREKTDQEAQHRYSFSCEPVAKMMAHVGPKLKKVGFGDLQLEKGGDKIGFEKQTAAPKGEKETDKTGFSPSLEKGFEPKSEKKGAKSGFSGGGTGN